MHLRSIGVFLGSALLLAPAVGYGAAETALHEVNTSVGVKPTTVKNKFKLETDPEGISDPPAVPDPTISQYIPVEGMLNNHYDTTQFSLFTNPSTGSFSLGDSVQGEGAFEVIGFKVQTVMGGLIDVADNGLGGNSYSTETEGTAPNGDAIGPVGGGYTGNVFDIHFKLINDRKDEVLPADQDQNFYQLFLNLIGDNPPGLDSTFSTPDSFVTFAPSDPNSTLPAYQVTGDAIHDSFTPEVSTGAICSLAGLAMLLRRRKVGVKAAL